MPNVITDAFRAARESVRYWTPSRAGDGSLDLDVRAITNEINDLHRAVDRRWPSWAESRCTRRRTCRRTCRRLAGCSS